MPPVLSLLLLALAVPLSAALLAAAAPAVAAHAIALEAKYLVGRCLAFVALVALAPILLGLALAIRVTSPGPVLFRQCRVGEEGELFEMLKFRSMRLADDTGFVPVAGAAPGGVEGIDRRTAIGRFTRRT